MNEPATEATKTQLENNITALMADRFASLATAIATKKYLTPDNQLVHLTQCNVAETAVPRLRIQVFTRVEGGVHELSYAMFSDHRFEFSQNSMIFGQTPPADQAPQPVSEETAQGLLQLIGTLGQARQTL